MKKFVLFPKAPNKETRTGDTLLVVGMILLPIYGLAQMYMNELMCYLSLGFCFAVMITGVVYKFIGMNKYYRYLIRTLLR